MVIETDHETGRGETSSEAVTSTEPETSEVLASTEPAPSANWFESLDKETRQQMAETKKMEGNELFGKACFQLACKKYAEVIYQGCGSVGIRLIFDDQKLEKFKAEKYFNFFGVKNYNLPIPRPP